MRPLNFGTVFVEPDYYAVLTGETLDVPAASGLLLNDDATLGGLSAISYTQPAHGTVTVSADGSFIYTPDAGYVGLDTFTYIAGAGIVSSTATVTVNVFQPLLVATPDVYTVHTGDTLLVTGPNNLIGNDFTNGGTIDATSFSSPSHGMLSVSLTGDITYVPDPGYIGTDTFTYYISNGYGTAFAVDTIDVVGAPPVAAVDNYTVQAGKTLLVDAATGLLANDIAFGGTVDATSFSSPSHGMLSVSLTGALTYVPDPGFVGTDSFTYYISDGTQTAYAVDNIDVVD
jgi:LysM repeat protein